MEFVNPLFLFGLSALAIPVIIHLFNFRRFRKVYFTNVAFIKELKQETRKQSRLKHLLVLLARLLAVAALVLAFSQPYIPVSNNILQPEKQNTVSIFIDNSFSMQADSEKGSLLNLAIEKAREIASVYKSSDRFLLLTNDFEGRHQRFVSKEEFLDLLDEITFSPVVKNFNEVKTRQNELNSLELSAVKTSYVISDYQVHFFKDVISETDTTQATYLIPVSAFNSDNLYIDSCWFDTPVQQMEQLLKLNVRIQNSSDNTFEKIPVKLKINDTQRALASFDINAREQAVVSLPFTNKSTGIKSGELEINDYQINFDDKFYFSYFVLPNVRVLSINQEDENFFLNSLFANDSVILFENANEGSLNYSSLNNYQLIVLNELEQISSGLQQELKNFINEGGSIVVLPSLKMDYATYNTFLSSIGQNRYSGLDTANQKVSYINLEHPLFTGVFDGIPDNMDLPYVNQSFKIYQTGITANEKLLELQNGNDFFSLSRWGKGKLYLSAVPLNLEFSTFPGHALFVPVFYKIAISSIADQDLYLTIGKNEIIHLSSIKIDPNDIIKIARNEFEIIPERRRIGYSEDLYVHDQVKDAGNYMIVVANADLKSKSFNYNRLESNMVFNSIEDLEKVIDDNNLKSIKVLETGEKPFVQTLSDLSKGIQLWKWLVLMALLFLLTEVLLLRFVK